MNERPAMVRAKFQCISVKEKESNIWDSAHKTVISDHGIVYEYEFMPVTGGSPENDLFFASTPYGNLTMGAVRDNLFEKGQTYYLDFIISKPEPSV